MMSSTQPAIALVDHDAQLHAMRFIYRCTAFVVNICIVSLYFALLIVGERFRVAFDIQTGLFVTKNSEIAWASLCSTTFISVGILLACFALAYMNRTQFIIKARGFIFLCYIIGFGLSAAFAGFFGMSVMQFRFQNPNDALRLDSNTLVVEESTQYETTTFILVGLQLSMGILVLWTFVARIQLIDEIFSAKSTKTPRFGIPVFPVGIVGLGLALIPLGLAIYTKTKSSMYTKITLAVYNVLILFSAVWTFYCVWHSRKASERFSDFASNAVMFTFFFVMYEAFFIFGLASPFNENLPYQIFMAEHTLNMLSSVFGVLNTFGIQLVVYKILDRMNYFSEAIKRRPSFSGTGSTKPFIHSSALLSNKNSLLKQDSDPTL